jgi:hypothetical protein
MPSPQSVRAGIAGVLVSALPALAQTQLIPTAPAPTGVFGGCVAAVPDFNGDARTDVVVGAPGETVNGIPGAGRAYVYSGAIGNLVRTLVSPTPVLNGAFGACVAGVPDADGDGRGDIAVSAPDENGGGIFASGKVYLFSGATGVLLRTYISPGRVTGGNFGASISGMGDVSGDNRGDILIGAPGENVPFAPSHSGRAYIFSGRSGGLWRAINPPVPEANGQFGMAVSGVPDVDGNGRWDAIVGAPREHPFGAPVNAGRAHVYSGSSGQRLYTLVSLGQQANGFFGESVAGMDDANGDGRGEVLVGAPLEHPGASPVNCGRAYIYSGATGGFYRKLLPPFPVTDGQFGIAVAGLPDTNLDGRGDAIVGAWQEGTPANSGAIHVYSGAGGTVPTVAPRLMTLFSPNAAADGRFGVAVAGLGNSGGSTRGDWVVGASTETAPGRPAESGRAYIFRR